MSRIRIVKGVYNKITHGDHSMYSKESINSFAGEVVKEKGEEEGVSYGNPKEPPKHDILGQCIVHFRPTSNYKTNPNFGFDWIRTGDTGYKGDIWYKDIIGKYKNPSDYSKLMQVSQNGVLVPDIAEFNKLCNSFQAFSVKINKVSSIYYVPKMTLRKGSTANLILKLKVEKEPKKLIFQYNKNIFEIADFAGDKIQSKGVGTRVLPISIKCKDIFSSAQSIKILADNLQCGKLNVLPNNFEYPIKVVFVNVKTSIGGSIQKGTTYSAEKEKVKKVLSQAYSNATIEQDVSLNLTGFFTSAWFKWWYTQNGQIKTDELHKYLNEKLIAIDEKYKSYYKIYVFGSSAGGLNGIAENVGHGALSAIVFPGRASSDSSFGTAAHELLHSIALFHTFDNDSQFTLKRATIDNIMDYSHWNGIERISTSHWQWSRIQAALSGYKKNAT